MSSAMPNTSYAAVLTVSSTTTAFASNANCSFNDAGCYYFNVTSKTASGFTIELRQTKNGALVTASANVTVDYIAIANQ